MGLLKKLYDKLHPAPETPPLSTPSTRTEAIHAQERATSDLREAVQNAPNVTNLSSRLQDQLIRNHFGDMVEASMRARG